MTGAVPLRPGDSDAELAVAAAQGDRQALAAIYDRYADRLYDFCVGMVGDRDAAADCVQDVFCVAATNLHALREPDKLRPWLYSVARHHAMGRLRDRYREQVSDDLPDSASMEAGPDTMAGRSELANLIAAAAGGLSDRDRMLLELTYRHGLDGPELADALGVTLTSANTMVFRLRKTIERSLGALLVARDAQSNHRACPELAAMLVSWDGQFTVLTRKRVARHIESCATCEQEQRRRVNPVALLGGAPVFIPAPTWLRDQTFRRVQLTSASTGLNPAAVRPSPHQDVVTATATPDAAARTGRPDGRLIPLIALIIGIPLSCLGLTIAWLRPFDAAVSPAAVPESAQATPTVSTPLVPRLTPTTTPLPSPVTTTPTRTVPTRTIATPLPAPTQTLTTTDPSANPDTTAPPTTSATTSDTTPVTTTTRTTPSTTPATTSMTTADSSPDVTTTTTGPYYPPATTTPWPTVPRTTPAPEPIPSPIPTPTPSSALPDGPVIH